MAQMSTKAFAELLAQLGDTQEKQAAALGIGRRSLVRYTQGKAVPPPVRRLALMLAKHGALKNVKGW